MPSAAPNKEMQLPAQYLSSKKQQRQRFSCFFLHFTVFPEFTKDKKQ